MIGKLPQYSMYSLTKGFLGRVGIKAASQAPITRVVEKACQYSQFAQKTTVISLGVRARGISPGGRHEQGARCASILKSEVASVKSVWSGGPRMDLSNVPPLKSPALVQAQQAKNALSSDQPGSEARNETLVSQPQHAPAASTPEEVREDGVAMKSFTVRHPAMDEKSEIMGKKHASIDLAEKTYRESIHEAVRILKSLENKMQDNLGELSIIAKNFSDEEMRNIRRALHERHVIPLVKEAKKQILELSGNLDDFFNRHDFSGCGKSKAAAFQFTARKFFSRNLVVIENLGLSTLGGGSPAGHV